MEYWVCCIIRFYCIHNICMYIHVWTYPILFSSKKIVSTVYRFIWFSYAVWVVPARHISYFLWCLINTDNMFMLSFTYIFPMGRLSKIFECSSPVHVYNFLIYALVCVRRINYLVHNSTCQFSAVNIYKHFIYKFVHYYYVYVFVQCDRYSCHFIVLVCPIFYVSKKKKKIIRYNK